VQQQNLGENICHHLYYHQKRNDKFAFRHFRTFIFILAYRTENGKRITERENKDSATRLIIFCYYCVMLRTAVASNSNTIQYTAYSASACRMVKWLHTPICPKAGDAVS
jgi:hypothetical protein